MKPFVRTPFTCSDILSQNVHFVASQYEHLQTFAGSEKVFGIREVMDNSRFRSLQKLLRVICYVRRFVGNLKVILGKVRKVCSGEILAEGMDSSTNYGLNMNNYFYEEKLILQK